MIFFCGDSAAGDSFHKTTTFQIDGHVMQCAFKLQDKPLLAKLSAGDSIAHIKCLVSLDNRTGETKSPEESDVIAINNGITFDGQVSNCIVEEIHMDHLVAPVFKMTDLANLYSNRLKEIGTEITGHVHSSKLKNRILTYFPDTSKAVM